MKKTKKGIIFLVIAMLALAIFVPTNQNLKSVHANIDPEITRKATILIDRATNSVLSEENSHQKLPIASVTKLMTVLLSLEQIQQNNLSLEQKITVSENASGMGGSQIFLEANQEYNLGDLLKSVIVASANDSSVALAEYFAGSEQNFVSKMNERAKQLNMLDTNYSNCTGLPSNDGYSSAYDQAILLNSVLDFELYHEYSSIWMEDFVHPTGRTTQMTNTNKLSRFYDGCIGGKTGSTNQAKYCLAVGAKRGESELVAVVLGADNSKERFKLASDLLNYGFSNFKTKTIFSTQDLSDKQINIKGKDRCLDIVAERDYKMLTKIDENPNYSFQFNLPNQITETNKGDCIGNVEIYIDGIKKDTINILSNETVELTSVWDYIKDIINS